MEWLKEGKEGGLSLRGYQKCEFFFLFLYSAGCSSLLFFFFSFSISFHGLGGKVERRAFGGVFFF